MLRLFVLTISILYSCFALAKSSYQVDLILFAHPQIAAQKSNLVINYPMIPVSQNAITLKNNPAGSYSLLPPSQSGLKDEYYLLSRKSRFQVIGHYSWRQPGNNESSVSLPEVSNKGWQMQGLVSVQKSNYYLLDADIQLSSPDNPQSSFTVSQKQRLKDSVVYFLDHPQVGMIIKVHKLA